MAQPPITFGIELELICAWPTDRSSLLQKLRKTPMASYFKNVEEYDETEADVVIEAALNAAGIPTSGYEEVCINNDREEPYSRWTVSVDGIDLSKAEYKALPDTHEDASVELSSRIFDLHRDDWRREIKVVLDVLRGLEDLGCRMFNNDSTGFHVHVGNGKRRKVDLRVAKNVCQLATAFERLTDDIHAVNRIDYPVKFLGDFYHAPMSWWHRNNGHWPADANAMLYDWLTDIEQAQTYAQLGHLFVLPDLRRMPESFFEKPTYGHNSAYNFENLWADANGMPPRYEERLSGTIEFRQHAGTLDFIEIVAWVAFTTSLVSFCSTAKAAQVLALCAHGIDLSFDLRDFLSSIGCPGDVVTHYCRAQEHRAGNGEEDDDEVPLGFIGNHAPIMRDETATLDDLIAHNDVEQSERNDLVEKFFALGRKDYGFVGDANVLNFPVEAFERYYVEARLEAFQLNDGLVNEALVDSLARALVLLRLAKIYAGDAKEAELAAAEPGPVVSISRIPDCMPGHEGTILIDDD